MKKLTTMMAALCLGFGLAANAQTLLYQWAFTNSADTFTNSAASYAVTPGTGNLIRRDASGSVIGLTGADAVNPLCYFTNANTGPGSGPGVNANGAFVANGQGYNGGNNAIAIATNLNLGSISKITVTFWVKMGASVSAQFPRFLQFYQTPAYDVGGKGSGNHNGLGASLNGWAGGIASQEQSGIANNTSGQQTAVTISGNPAIAPGYLTDGATWFFEAITYDGALIANNFTTWVGTLNTNVQPFVLTANYSSINFTTNATVMIGGNVVAGSSRSLSSGAIADVRIYSGVLTSNMLENIRNFRVDGVIAVGSYPPTVTTQPASGKTFVGGSRTFSVVADANPAVYKYLWRSNGIPVVGGTNASLTLNNVTAVADGATFVCSVTNFSATTPVGGTNSTVATLTVLTPTPGSYAQAVFTNSPYSFWQVNELTNTAEITVFDYANGHDGSVPAPNNMFFTNGPTSPNYPGFTTINTAIQTRPNIPSRLNLANPGNFPNTGMTICGWVNTPGLLTANGLIFDLISDTAGGFGLQAGANDGTHNQINYQWGQTSVASGLYFNTGEWTFIALVISTNLTQADIDGSIMADTNAIVYVGSDTINLQAFTNSTALNGTAMPGGTSASPLVLGRTTVGFSENGSFVSVNSAQFNSVAVFYQALSTSTISNLYVIGAGVPVLSVSGVSDPGTPGNFLLTWPFGILQEATSVAGPYTDVAGPPTSPYSVPMTGATHFYRLRN